MRLSTKRFSSGVTLIESTVATAIAAIFLGSLFTINTSSMQTVKTAREAASASQVLQQRVESMRIANWHQITDSSWLRDNLLNSDAPGTTALKSPSEQVTIVPYGSSTTGNIQLNRSNGTTTVINSTPLLAENAIKVIWTITYSGTPRDRSMTRQLTTILAKGGVAKW
jgi:type II secretory pathway pseudopilin PulG